MSCSSSSNQTIVIGNSIDININPHNCNSEIRTDVVVSELTAVRLWGQIVNCEGIPVPNAMIKLVKIIEDEYGKSYKGIAHTLSDCEGFYQFNICSDENGWYKILVGKSNTGKEIIVSSSNQNCPSYQSEPSSQSDRAPYYPSDSFLDDNYSYPANAPRYDRGE